jgi:hypothetical protein
MTLRATKHVPAGMELFANFGEVWDEASATYEDMFEQKLIHTDYIKADALVEKLVQLLDHPDVSTDPELREDTLDLVLERILPVAGGKRAKAIKSLIPSTSRKLKQVQDSGTFKYRHADMIKSSKWLRKNAVCVDTMEPGKSSIEGAGRGAFATRNIKKGDRVTISPMIPIYDDVLQMFGIQRKESWLEFTDDHRGQQILLNYAFGHPHSQMLFLPTAPLVTLINHDSKHPNVELEWADHDKLFNNVELLGKTVEELRKMDPQPNFVMQFTALRDVSKGEEIVMDYGLGWEDSWNEYHKMNDWTRDWPLRAIDVQQTHLTKPYPAVKSDASPYPDGIATACFLLTDEVEDSTPKKTEQGYTILRWIGPATYEAYQGRDLDYCEVVSRTGDDGDLSSLQYTVLTSLEDNKDETVQVIGVPHSAIVLVNRPYESDIHTKGAFRRWISIRDELIPQVWRMRDILTEQS